MKTLYIKTLTFSKELCGLPVSIENSLIKLMSLEKRQFNMYIAICTPYFKADLEIVIKKL